MIEIREATTKKEQRRFLNFPLDLYSGNPCFVPPLYGDEKKIFCKDYVYNDTCEAVYYNAYRDGRIVGRISGILQKAANAKNGEKPKMQQWLYNDDRISDRWSYVKI